MTAKRSQMFNCGENRFKRPAAAVGVTGNASDFIGEADLSKAVADPRIQHPAVRAEHCRVRAGGSNIQRHGQQGGASVRLSLTVRYRLAARGKSPPAFERRCARLTAFSCEVYPLAHPGLKAPLVAQICPIFSLLAPCQTGASFRPPLAPLSVLRRTFATGC